MMYYHYIMMNLHTFSDDNKGVRTQITLTQKLKTLVESASSLNGESLSGYLRKAALLRLKLEQQAHDERVKLAQKVIGSLKNTKNPLWKDKKSIYRWSRKIREEW